MGPNVTYEIEEALYCCESPLWQCIIDPTDMRCLRAVNKTQICLPDPAPNSIGVHKLDTGVKVAVPADYSVIVLELETFGSRAHAQQRPLEQSQLFPRIANGVVDSGYRGVISLVVYYDVLTRRIDRGCLCVRFALVKLSALCPTARMLFDLYDAGADYECGFKFVSSIRSAADSDAADGERQPPPDGNDVWDGTGCSDLVCLRSEGVALTSHYSVDDPRVAFVVNTGSVAVMGLRPGSESGPIPPVKFFNSGDFCTLLPFFDTFGHKRAEDAGYDVLCPVDAVLEPMTATSITVRQRYCCQDGSIIPVVYGRSSMNSKGLPIIPTRWMAGEWLTVTICNTNIHSVKIHTGEKIAQLLLLARDGNAWLPYGVNASDPFPRSFESKFECRGACSPVPRWKLAKCFNEEAPASERGAHGFGSTGL